MNFPKTLFTLTAESFFKNKPGILADIWKLIVQSSAWNIMIWKVIEFVNFAAFFEMKRN